MIQVLQGVKITPKGANNRFASQNWPNSYAFGGWIYNVSASLNFSDKPTEIKVNIVLETTSFSQSKAKFDILESDLHCDAGDGGLNNETWYDLNIEGFNLSNFLLHSFDYGIENGQKILNVTFKDYSLILDKIYIGLFKKQGYKYPHLINCQLELPIRCQDCEYTGASITGTGFAARDIGFGCYIGNNGATHDLFSNSYYSQGNVFKEWGAHIIDDTSVVSQFDLNGGYLILGTESATEDRCNSAPNITYSFPELLGALRKGGIHFSGDFPTGTADSDYVYRANHNGSLREVLQHWSSDLAYSFYCSGRTVMGINLKNPIDISELTNIADPNSRFGQSFEINSPSGNSAILSFKTKSSLDNTFRQAVVVDNSYPITQRDVSKSVKKYVGITPLHPISINEIDRNTVISGTNLYGQYFNRCAYETNAFDTWISTNYGSNISPQAYKLNFSRLDGRSYADVDAAVALSNYSDVMRDIFVAQRALNNISTNPIAPNGGSALSNPYCVANFNALGLFPILEITGEEMKSNIILDNFKNADRNGIANINIERQYFRVFLGYYYEDLKNDIVTWEKAAAGSMYKYGMISKGVLTGEPFMPANILTDISPTQGFYGGNGLVYNRVTSSYTPTTDRYNDVKFSPFLDVMLDSGYVRSVFSTGIYYSGNTSYNAFVPPGYADYAGRIPTGLWISTLDNPWGLTQHEFDVSLAFTLDDPCAQSYPLDQSVSQILTESDMSLQDWKLEYFKYKVNPDLSSIYEFVQGDEFNFSGVVDEVLSTYQDFHFLKKKECKKLHIIVIPDTLAHPNINIEFSPRGVNKINPAALKNYKQRLYEADLRRNTTETPSICSISLLEEMCRNVLSGASGFNQVFNPPLTVQQTGCVILEDKNNYMLEGFDKGLLFSANSRSLDISITKNPVRNIYPTFDVNGDYYYSDLNLGNLLLETATVNTSIIYPLQGRPNAQPSYSGICSSDITTEYRIPAFAEVYGEPVNTKNNNTQSFKLVNNPVDNTLNPILDPLTNEVKSYITVLDGVGNSLIKTPQAYYDYIKALNNYNLIQPTKEVSLSLAGPPSQFGQFVSCLTPGSGLQQFQLSVTDNGVKTDLVFADRPKVLPQQESILNKIGARIKGTYN